MDFIIYLVLKYVFTSVPYLKWKPTIVEDASFPFFFKLWKRAIINIKLTIINIKIEGNVPEKH